MALLKIKVLMHLKNHFGPLKNILMNVSLNTHFLIRCAREVLHQFTGLSQSCGKNSLGTFIFKSRGTEHT